MELTILICRYYLTCISTKCTAQQRRFSSVNEAMKHICQQDACEHCTSLRLGSGSSLEKMKLGPEPAAAATIPTMMRCGNLHREAEMQSAELGSLSVYSPGCGLLVRGQRESQPPSLRSAVTAANCVCSCRSNEVTT